LKNLLGSDFLLIFAADMDKKRLDTAYFISFCIEQYKMATKQTGSEVEQMFSQQGVIKFLIDHYEVLHTQSAQFIQEEIGEYLNNHQL
jgi:hypothetical protein